jgi:hypothetical protein
LNLRIPEETDLDEPVELYEGYANEIVKNESGRDLHFQIIAVLEIVGGMCGIGLVFSQYVLYDFNAFGPILVSLIVYTSSVLAGLGLWRSRSWGWAASLLLQSIQLLKVYSSTFTFTFSFGFDAYISWVQVEGLSNLGLNFKFLAFHQIFVNFPNAPDGLGVSLTACLAIATLIKHKRLTIDNA